MGLSMARECTYIPDFDQVAVPARGGKGVPQEFMAYDCAKNQWLKLPNPCSKPDKRGRMHPGYGVSTGVEWDPKRKLLWLVQTNGAVYAMRYDPKTAGLTELKVEKHAIWSDDPADWVDTSYAPIVELLPEGTGPSDFVVSVNVTARKSQPG